MKNVKLENNLVGEGYWPKMAFVDVPMDQAAKDLPANLTVEEKEKIIQSWNKVAVLEVTPAVPFKTGFIVDDTIQYLKAPIETSNNLFGMRIGSQNIRFFVIPTDLETELTLKLVEITDETNPKYPNLPLY